MVKVTLQYQKSDALREAIQAIFLGPGEFGKVGEIKEKRRKEKERKDEKTYR